MSSESADPDGLIIRLQEENNLLKAQLLQAQQHSIQDSATISNLEKEVESLKKKTTLNENADKDLDSAATSRIKELEAQNAELEAHIKELQLLVESLPM